MIKSVFCCLSLVVALGGWCQVAAHEESTEVIPVVIIGSGPAGLSAALYAARAQVKTVVFTGPMIGGLLTETSFIENWPGVRKIRASDVMATLRAQAEEQGALIKEEAIASVDVSARPFRLMTESGQEINAATLIIATGATPKVLGIPGEKEYWTRGVSSCAICDGICYRGKNVAVVGGGDSAIEQAVHLSAYARQVTIIVRGDALRAASVMQKKIHDYPNILFLFNKQVCEVCGNGENLTGLILRDTLSDTVETVPVDGLFLAIGHTPNTSLIRGQVDLTDNGYIVLSGRSQKTSREGVFAAGDSADSVYRQAGVAAGDGIKAALDALAFLRSGSFKK